MYRFPGRIGVLDEVFGEFLGNLGDDDGGTLNEDTVKKLRRHMTALRQP
jgi:hypothetical protein